MTKTFQIENLKSGVILGQYQGNDEAEALDAMARDAGYHNYDALQELVHADGDEISIKEV